MNLNKLAMIFASGVMSILIVPDAVGAETKNQLSNNGFFNVTLLDDVELLPLREFVELKIQVLDANGAAVTGADVVLSGGMPAHGHGLPTKPVVTSLGAGEYFIEGLKFSMVGTWELNLDIKTKEVSDSVVFIIEK